MKKSDRMILLVLPVIALVVGFYLLAISPKQKQIGELDDEIATLESRVSDAEAQVATAEAARKSFPRNYAQIVSMGSAVPEDSDQATLIYDLTQAGDATDVHFRSFEVADDGAAAEAAAPPASTGTTTTDSSSTDSGSSGDTATDSTTTTTTTTAPVTATETEAATLPIGATVGSAGLPVMPYKLRFSGSFFDMADFFAELDKSVDVVNDGQGDPKVDGRLMTINGFAMVGDPIHGFPLVQSSMSVNTYVVPGDQGLENGATPAGPSPVGDSSSTVTSTSTSSSSVPSTAAVSP
ncbi:MAG: type II secretion system protein M [Solirubrobacterales bacterium]|nr:type II secretion system protein M [Solirubrobacterales bacterium]